MALDLIFLLQAKENIRELFATAGCVGFRSQFTWDLEIARHCLPSCRCYHNTSNQVVLMDTANLPPPYVWFGKAKCLQSEIKLRPPGLEFDPRIFSHRTPATASVL